VTENPRKLELGRSFLLGELESENMAPLRYKLSQWQLRRFTLAENDLF
jgi:hypothetical protein